MSPSHYCHRGFVFDTPTWASIVCLMPLQTSAPSRSTPVIGTRMEPFGVTVSGDPLNTNGGLFKIAAAQAPVSGAALSSNFLRAQTRSAKMACHTERGATPKRGGRGSIVALDKRFVGSSSDGTTNWGEADQAWEQGSPPVLRGQDKP